MKLNVPKSVSRRAFLAGSAVAAASTGMSLVGCSAPAPSSAAQSSAGAQVSSTSSAPSQTHMIRAAFAYASTNYNPIGLNGGASTTMAATRHVFEALYDIDPRTGVPYAALAAGDPVRLSETSYEIALREEARYSNGAYVTAADVVNAFEANLANGTVGPLLDFIEAVAEKDERTVALTLKYPFEGLLESRLSLVKVFPAALESQLSTMPVGSGPWAYLNGSLDGTRVISFEPNVHYNGPFPARADIMMWSIMDTSANMRVTALHDHAVQAAEAIPSQSVDRLERADVTVEYVQGFSQAFLMFNTLKRPFSDKRVRQALLYAIDVHRLIDERLADRATPLTGFLPKGHPNYHRASTVYSYDPDLAKSLLADAGYSSISLKLLVNNNWVSDLADQIADDFKGVGVECIVKKEPIRWNEFGDTGEVLPYDVVLASGDPSCFGNDPDLLLSWWYGDNIWTNGRSCWARDESGSFEEMQVLLQSAREAQPEDRQGFWNQCFDIIADEVPLYGLFHRQLATGWQPSRIEGFKPLATSGLNFLGCSVNSLE